MANEETWFTSLQDISALHSIQSNLGPKQPPVRWAPGTLLLRVNQPWYKAHNIQGTSIQCWDYEHASFYLYFPMAFMVWCFIKHKNM